MPPLSILIKPASSICNLRCEYCFYHDVAENREVQSYGIMQKDLLETIVRKAFAQAEGACTFAFQGGEPTMAGLDFYKEFVALQKRYNPGGIQIYNSIQTNGILIDPEWARFLKQNRFLVGLSLDGDRTVHDANRIFPDGRGTFDTVQKTVKILNRYAVEYNILCVVTAQTCQHVEKIYKFFKQKGLCYLQFIPCLDPLGEERGRHPYSLTPDKYESFLKKLFDCWYEDFKKGTYISIRHFDNWISMLMGYPPESCGMSGACTCYFVIEADGSVYPCDFYVLDEYKLGNIQKSGFMNLMNQPAAKRFVEESRGIYEHCRNCKFYSLCRGGCRRDRTEGLTSNYYCSALYGFFTYAIDRMKEIAETVQKRK